jgi:hypothetical protein
MESQIGKTWSPPVGDQRYILLRFDCSLHPPEDDHMRYAEATLRTSLQPSNSHGHVIVHDLYPRRVTATDTRKLNLKLGPDLKFGMLNVNLAQANLEIEHHNAFPVIQAYGLGESQPYWQFAHHSKNPLLGCQSVYMVLSAPRDASEVKVLVELTATLETRFGPLRLGMPRSTNASLIRMIG